MACKKFVIVEPTLRATIKLVELRENMETMSKESEKLNSLHEQLKIVTGGAYDPADESVEINSLHAGELISSFLSGQTPS